MDVRHAREVKCGICFLEIKQSEALVQRTIRLKTDQTPDWIRSIETTEAANKDPTVGERMVVIGRTQIL